MKYMTIDGVKVAFQDEKNVLAVIRKAGIELPTFCYYTDLSIYGACRMCVIENEWGSVEAACSTTPRDGMTIKTNTPKLQKYRKMILELLLSNHCRDCTTCEKNGKCRLQELAIRYGISRVRFDGGEPFKKEQPLDLSSPCISRDPNKCILCGDCVRMCAEIQNVGAIDFAHRGSEMIVTPAFEEPLSKSNCVGCGQCAAVCPTAAITIKDDTQRLWDAIFDENRFVVAQIAPAVRVAIGSEFGFPEGENTIGYLATAMRMLGFDRVYDTSIGADMTILEEAGELKERLEKGGKFPMFTSCCPAWVQYAEMNHPELLDNLSTCRSPMQMFGSVLKLKDKKKPYRRKSFVVAIMPCTAKKYEAIRPEFRMHDDPNIDAVITTQELVTMIKEAGIQFEKLLPEALDMPFGIYSGAGVLFGASGGVTEAAVRALMHDKNPNKMHDLEFAGFRGIDGIKEAHVEIDGLKLSIAMVSGLKNAELVIEGMEKGEMHFDFIEVMACPGGCISGAGQPNTRTEGKKKRAEGIYRTDRMSQFKRSNENPAMEAIYRDYIGDKHHEYLHTHYTKK